MKKRLISVIIALLCLSSVFVGCNKKNNKGDKVDGDKTQIYVYAFSRGYGSEYLYKLKSRYEALHANDEGYEKGKKGVQIVIKPSDDNSSTKYANTFKNQKGYDVFFAEDSYYRVLASAGTLLDLTDSVTSASGYDGKTIASKFNTQQDDYLKVDGKYYGVPHYQGEYGFVYDVDLFEKKGYFFRDGYTVEAGFKPNECDSNLYGDFYSDEMFVAPNDKTTKRTAGPDCKYNTADDGLPTTYDEFFFLLEHIASSGDIPVSWAGSYYNGYLNNLTHSLVTDYEGFNDMKLNYSFNGTDVEMIKLDQNGKMVKDTDGNPVIESFAVTESEAPQVRRQAGLYNALKFMNAMMNTPRYHVDDSFAYETFEHTANQEKFLWSSLRSEAQPIAMIIDGCWWQREAEQSFKDIVEAKGENYSANKRNIGWLPLPKASIEKRDADAGKTTHNDVVNSFVFARASIEDYKKELVKDFIQFVCSDDSLVEFTLTTNTMKALTYKLNDSEQAKLTPFGKSLYNACLSEKSQTLYPYASSAKYVNNIDKYGPAYYNIGATQSVVGYLHDSYSKGNNVFKTDYAVTAFESINKYFKSVFN